MSEMTCEECGTGSPTEHDRECSQRDVWKIVTANEVRTTSETGGQKGVKPQRMSLLPFRALAKISEVYGFGEKKYAAHNWRLGYEWDKSLDALERHIGAFKDGEDNDPESGLSHIAHAGFHILTLLVFILDPRYKRFDNRWATMEERKRNEEVPEDPSRKNLEKMPRLTIDLPSSVPRVPRQLRDTPWGLEETGEVMKGP
jgi:hypothetical protein